MPISITGPSRYELAVITVQLEASRRAAHIYRCRHLGVALYYPEARAWEIEAKIRGG